jgi:hypothetical protein
LDTTSPLNSELTLYIGLLCSTANNTSPEKQKEIIKKLGVRNLELLNRETWETLPHKKNPTEVGFSCGFFMLVKTIRKYIMAIRYSKTH